MKPCTGEVGAFDRFLTLELLVGRLGHTVGLRTALDQQAGAADSGTVIEQKNNPHARDERFGWFGLEGDFDPDDISRATGLTP